MARIWTFGGLGGTRTQIKLSQLGEFIIDAGDFIDAFQMFSPDGNGTVRYGGAGGGQPVPIAGGIIGGVKFNLLQSVIADGIEILNYMELEDPIHKTIYKAGKKVTDPHAEWPSTGQTYLLVWVGHGAYIDGIGFSEILG